MIDAELVKRALAFYERCPDGQYDRDVVVPILKEWLERAEWATEHFAMWEKLNEALYGK